MRKACTAPALTSQIAGAFALSAR